MTLDVERKSWWRPQPRGPIIATRRGAVIIVLRLRGAKAVRLEGRTVAYARGRFDVLGEQEAERMVGGEG